ncbi:MAG: TolC family protein [Verrucomicrobiales bacterium]
MTFRCLPFFLFGLAPLGAAPAVVEPGASAPQPVIPMRTERTGRLPLREVIRLTLERNPLIEIRREAVAAAWAGEVEADAAFDPTLSATLDAGKTRQASAASELDGSSQPESDAFGATTGVEKPMRDGSSVGVEWDALDRSSTNSSFSSLNPSYDSALRLTLRKPLLRGSGREVRFPMEFARLDSLRTAEEWRAEIEEVLLDVEKSYWEIQARSLEKGIREQGLELARLILEETEARGSTKVEVLEARANVVRREAGIAQAKKDYDDALDELFRLAGLIGQSEPGALALDALPAAEGPVPDTGASYADAIANGVEARLEENALQAARVEMERAKLGLRPTLDLAASGGVLGRDGSYGPSNKAMIEGDGRFYQAGLELRFPWDLRAEKARLKQAESRLKQENGRIENARLELFTSMREITRRVSTGLELLRAAATAVELNRARFEEQRARRAAGEAILRDVLEAQTALDVALLEELRARLDVISARLELERARGMLPARHGLALDLRVSSPDL